MIRHCRAEKMAEMARFQDLCDRWDNLYYPNTVHKDGGPDHWPDHMTAKIEGQVHISLNVYPEYVDIPASLQSVEPVENIQPAMDNPQARDVAAQVERVYFSWKDEVDFETKAHMACVVKGLYGRTAAKVFWDNETGHPTIEIIDQPKNLWLGWASQNYKKLDWALYSYRISLTEAVAQYGVDVDMTDLQENGKSVRLPFLSMKSRDVAMNYTRSRTTRDWVHDEMFMIECVDYWYRRPKPGATIVPGEPTEMETWNAIFVGNFLVKDMPHPEYDGELPYVPLFNTYLPGIPDGRSEYYDLEQLIREKEERLSAGGAMIRKVIKGQMWQLTGAEAPDVVPNGMKPKDDTVVAPGAGNRIEKIEPFVPEFALESYLTRLDREISDVTGLNDLLRGLAPQQVLSSSKAITALVANYEARIRMKRDLFYRWRKDIWALSKRIWGSKEPNIGRAFGMAGKLIVTAPSITPRDDLETAQLATTLLDRKVWSLARAMDRTGVDDPEAEQEIIRSERTDASLFPADVQVEVALAAQLQQMGMQQQMAQQQQQQTSIDQTRNAQRAALGGAGGSPQLNGAEENIPLPPEGLPSNAGGLPPAGPGENFLNQTQIKGGEANSRLLLQQPVQQQQGGGGGGP